MTDSHEQTTTKILEALPRAVEDDELLSEILEAGIVEFLATTWQEIVNVNPGPGMSYLTEDDYTAAKEIAPRVLALYRQRVLREATP